MGFHNIESKLLNIEILKPYNEVKPAKAIAFESKLAMSTISNIKFIENEIIEFGNIDFQRSMTEIFKKCE